MRNKKTIIPIAANALTLTLIAILAWAYSSMGSALSSQYAAERWSGESGERFTQISCYAPMGGELSLYEIASFRTTLDRKFIENSIEGKDGVPLYIDSYCAFANLSVTVGKLTAPAYALGVGGDFFAFHPLRLRSGGYISESDLMQDRVVLDEYLAWKLFGSFDVAGMEVYIGGVPFQVAGVVARDTDSATEKAYGEEAIIFVPYGLLAGESDQRISAYEIIMPNPISGFAMNLIKENFPLGLGRGDIVENTGRFGLENMLSLIPEYGERSMNVSGVIYPFWENAARYTEDILALCLVLIIILSLCPLAFLIYLIVRLFKYVGSRKEDIYKFLLDRYERIVYGIQDRRYEKKAAKESAKEEQKQPPGTKRTPAAPASVPAAVNTDAPAGVKQAQPPEQDKSMVLEIDAIVSEVLEERDGEKGE